MFTNEIAHFKRLGVRGVSITVFVPVITRVSAAKFSDLMLTFVVFPLATASGSQHCNRDCGGSHVMEGPLPNHQLGVSGSGCPFVSSGTVVSPEGFD